MDSQKSPLIIVLALILINVAAAISTNTKEARISNYAPSQSNIPTQQNANQQIKSYSIPSKPPPNSKKANFSNQFGDEREEFLKAHNGARQRSGMTLLVWDTKLAAYAARYASNRHDDCDMVHSFGKYGENIFWGSGNEWTPTEVVKLWVKEHRYYDRKTNKCMSGHMCGHYTQIMWRNTRHLGCAKMTCATGDTFAICNYDPPGNFIGQSPFEYNN